jgi:hypothetical protein
MTTVPSTAPRSLNKNHQLQRAHERIYQLVVAGRLNMLLSRNHADSLAGMPAAQ